MILNIVATVILAVILGPVLALIVADTLADRRRNDIIQAALLLAALGVILWAVWS